MSTDPVGLSEADLDLLVDYTAGALTGVEQDRVERLIRADERWGDAHAAVLTADAAVTASLAALPAPEPMPADLAARLDAALAAIAVESSATVLSFPIDQARRSAPTDRARRRRLVMTIAGVAAAAVAIVGGITVAIQLAPRNDTATTASGSADRNEQAPTLAEPPGLSADTAAPRTIASGQDYQPDTLGQLAKSDPFGTPAPSPAAAGPGSGQQATTPPRNSDASKGAAPTPLQRLTDPAALADCLTAIGRVHAGSPRLVDYANFEGRPAILVLLRQGAIATVVVVGPDCGRDGADERYAANVG
jgi:hypothetical protein